MVYVGIYLIKKGYAHHLLPLHFRWNILKTYSQRIRFLFFQSEREQAKARTKANKKKRKKKKEKKKKREKGDVRYIRHG